MGNMMTYMNQPIRKWQKLCLATHGDDSLGHGQVFQHGQRVSVTGEESQCLYNVVSQVCQHTAQLVTAHQGITPWL